MGMSELLDDIVIGDAADYELNQMLTDYDSGHHLRSLKEDAQQAQEDEIKTFLIGTSGSNIDYIKKAVSDIKIDLDELQIVVDTEREKVKNCMRNAADHETFGHLLQIGRRIKAAQEELRKATFESDRL